MCNLYSLITPQTEIRASFGVARDLTGNLPAMPGIFPDQRAPIVRVAEDGERVLECPPSALLRQIEGLHERRIAGSS